MDFSKLYDPRLDNRRDDMLEHQASADDRNALIASLMKSSAMAGTIGGKQASAEPVSDMAKALQQSNEKFYRGMSESHDNDDRRRSAIMKYFSDKEAQQTKGQLDKEADESAFNYKKDLLNTEMAGKERLAKIQRPARSPVVNLAANNKSPGDSAKVPMTPAAAAAQAKTNSETTYRYNALINNSEKLKQLVKQHGTTEVTGSAGTEMDRLVYEMAIDYAKMVDPDSVAREGEVSAAQKYMLPFRESFMGIGPKGLGTTNETALSQIDNYAKALDDRLAARKAAQSGETAQRDGVPDLGVDGNALASPNEKVIKGKRYIKVPGGWQEAK